MTDPTPMEAFEMIRALRNGELWLDVRTGQWHRQGRRDFHDDIIEAWREPAWTARAQSREATR